MNSDKPHSNREQLEARLTALLLGELPTDEAERLSRAIEHDPALAKLHERLKQTVGLLKAASTTPQEAVNNGAEPLKLEEKRRQELLARFKTITPREFAPKPRPSFRLLELVAMVAIMAILAGMLFPMVGKVKRKARFSTKGAVAYAPDSSSGAPTSPKAFGNGHEYQVVNGNFATQPTAPLAPVTITAGVASSQVQPYLPTYTFNDKAIAGVPDGEHLNYSGRPSNERVDLFENTAPKGESASLVSSGSPGAAPVANRPNLAQMTSSTTTLGGEPKPIGILERPSAGPSSPASGSRAGGIVLPSNGEIASANTQLGTATIMNQDGSGAGQNGGALGAGAGGQPATTPGIAAANPISGSYSVSADSFNHVTITGISGGGGGGGGGGQPAKVPEVALNWDDAERLKQSKDGLADVGGKRSYGQTAPAMPAPATRPLADAPPPIDPATGLPVGAGPAIDPATGLPLPVETPPSVDVKAKFAEVSQNDANSPKFGFWGLHNETEGDKAAKEPVVTFGRGTTKEALAEPRLIPSDEGKGQSDSLHQKQGNLALADGSVSQFSRAKLEESLKNSGEVRPDAVVSGGGDKSVPVLGDVPMMGTAFRSRSGLPNDDINGRPGAGLVQIPPPANATASNPEEIIPPGMLDFRQADLNQVLRLYGELTGRTILRPDALPAPQIVLKTQTPLTKREAIQALDAALGMNGIVMVNIGDKFVKADQLAVAPSMGQAIPNDTLALRSGSAGQAADNKTAAPARELRSAIATNGVMIAGKDWNFPASSVTNAGSLARVERGGSWQTVFLPQDEAKKVQMGGDSSGVKAENRLALNDRERMVRELKLASESIDTSLPKTAPVEIMDPAQAGQAEKPTLGAKIRGFFSGETERKARIKIERDQSDISDSDQTVSRGFDPYFIQTEFETIQSDKVLGKVVKDLNLGQEWAKKSDGKPLDDSQAIALLKKKLDLRPVRNTSFIEIGAKGQNAEEAAKLANAVANAYKDHRAEQRKQMSVAGISALEERLTQNRQQIAEAQKEVNQLAERLEITDATASGGQAPVGRETLANKLSHIQVEAVNYDGLPLSEVLKNLSDQAKAHDRDGRGINFVINPTPLGAPVVAPGTVDPATGLPLTPATASAVDTGAIQIKTNLSKGNVRLADALDAIVRASDVPLKYSIEDYGIVFSQQDAATAKEPDLSVRRKPAADAPVPQPEVATADNAFSTFSLNVSDVSFKLAAASLEQGAMPEANSVRTEEFINAFDYRDPEPSAGIPVAFAWERARYPFAQNRDVVRLSLKTAAAGRQPGKPMNVVLLMDNSGSMERADRVTIIREALKVLAAQLRPEDKFSVVTFSRTARLAVDGVAGNEAAQPAETVSGLTPEGGTNLEEAMKLAYETALRHYLTNGINRVVLLTDGAANLGDVEPESLKQKVEANRKQGIAFDCFGIGWEGYNDDLLEVLSRNGDGRYGFINTPEEAATEFVGKLAGALHVAASDVKVQVEFNPKRVTVYRQLGYAKHQLTKEQFRDNTVDAAELGAAEAGNALYVIEVNPAGTGALGTVRVRYKVPGTADYREQEWALPYNGTAVALDQSSSAMKLAASASAFSEWLVASPYAGEVTPDALLGYLRGVPEVYGADGRPRKLEWMLRQAKSIAGH